MPGHVRWMPEPIREWLLDSPLLTRREFYTMFLGLFLLVTVSLVGLRHFAGENRERAIEGQKGHAFACAVTGNLKIRVRDSVAFLAAVERGERRLPAGFTVNDVLMAIARDQATIALSDAINLGCTRDELYPPVKPIEPIAPSTTTTKGSP